ncbi:MAG: tetratricopeptide repeat protein [Gallionella sp.]
MQQYLISWLRNNVGLVILLVAAFIIYAPGLSGNFIIDDVPQVRDNPYIRNFSHLARYFTKGLWENSALEITTEKRYLPMTLVPMLLNYQLWGSNPFGYHAFLLLLHLANTCLVYALIRKVVAGSAMAATVGAAIFVLHPTKVGSVAWIIGGVEPLVAFFLLGAMLAHRSYFESPKNNNGWRYLGLSLICFQLALWSKEVAIVFPLIIVAHDLIYRKKIDWLTAFLHILIVIGYLVARSVVLGKPAMTEGVDVSQFSRAIDFALGYSEMLVFPIHIPFYILPPEHSVSSAFGLVSAIVIFALVGFCWRAFDAGRRKTLTFLIVWMIVFFWPAILLAFYTEGYYSPRYLYVPSVGLAGFVAIFYDFMNTRYPRFKTLLMTCCAVVIASYGFLTWKEIPLWHDDGTIYGKVAEVAPENSIGFLGLGYFYFNHEDYAASERNFLLALRKAKTPSIRVESLLVLGTINGINNNAAQSEVYLREAVKIDPGNSQGWAGLGNLAWIRGRPDEAISFYEKALSLRPDNYEAAINLANAYDKTGQSQRGDLLRQQASTMRH